MIFELLDVLSTADVGLAQAALDMGVEMWLLPSNTSHFLQPLDEKVFASFKGYIAKRSYDLSVAASFSNVNLEQLWWSLAFEAEEAAFTDRIIKSAFRTTGLFPWDPARIKSRAEINAGKLLKSEGPLKRDVVEAAVNVIKKLSDRADALAKKTKGYTVSVVANELHSPYRRCEYHAEEQRRAQAKLAEKERKASEKEAQVAAKAAKRALQKCSEGSCEKVFRGGKTWSVCATCTHKFCFSHKLEFSSHSCDPSGQ